MNLVLVLDDHPDICDVVATALGDHGFNVVCVTSAPAALQQIRKLQPALVIADVRLRDGTGEAVADFAVAQGARVILMSGHPQEIERLKDGEYPFIKKPFGINALVSAVAAEMQQSAMHLQNPNHRRGPSH